MPACSLHINWLRNAAALLPEPALEVCKVGEVSIAIAVQIGADAFEIETEVVVRPRQARAENHGVVPLDNEILRLGYKLVRPTPRGFTSNCRGDHVSLFLNRRHQQPY